MPRSRPRPLQGSTPKRRTANDGTILVNDKNLLLPEWLLLMNGDGAAIGVTEVGNANGGTVAASGIGANVGSI